MLLNQGKTAEAEAAFNQAIALFRQENYEGIMKGQVFYDLAILYSRRDDFVAARECARQYYECNLKNIGPDHQLTAQSKLGWARFRAETGETKEAVDQAHEAMQVIRRVLPPLSQILWTPLNSASHILSLAGRFNEAEPLAREQLAIVDKPALVGSGRQASGNADGTWHRTSGREEISRSDEYLRKGRKNLCPAWPCLGLARGAGPEEVERTEITGKEVDGALHSPGNRVIIPVRALPVRPALPRSPRSSAACP